MRLLAAGRCSLPSTAHHFCLLRPPSAPTSRKSRRPPSSVHVTRKTHRVCHSPSAAAPCCPPQALATRPRASRPHPPTLPLPATHRRPSARAHTHLDISDPQEVCTSTVMGFLQSCGECAVNLGEGSVSDIQSVVDEFVDYCSQNGLQVNGVTVSEASSSKNPSSANPKTNGGERLAALGAVVSVVAPLATLLLAAGKARSGVMEPYLNM
ncbi:hypothetical protein GGX14DRAFT_399475 [Mycena pura]|uniref:Uncharacterized protein n=1 Tax=Mycena pura TaxID=153505 RepID=A0AAD6V7Z1_9AGAR|nr:hypothetical protein GGX14DRAFT_399475 [Mycena pura]